jgi:O-antigen ligase
MQYTGTGIFLAAALALFHFFTIQLLYGDINSKVFYIMVLADSVALIAAYKLFQRKFELIPFRWLGYAVVGLLAVLTASALLGVYPARSFWSDIFWGTGVIFFAHLALLVLLTPSLTHAGDWSLIRRSVAISAALFSLLTIVQNVGIEGRFLWVNLDPTLTLGNETYAGMFLLLALVLGLIEFARDRRWFIGVALCLIVLSPLLIHVRGFGEILSHPTAILGGARASSAAMYGLILYLVGYVAFKSYAQSKWQRRAIVAWSSVVLLVAAASTLLLLTPGSFVQKAYIEESSAARVIVWNAGLRAFTARPVFGWGPENFNFAFESHFDNTIFEERNLGEIWFERAHNIFVDTLATTGSIGMLSVLALIIAYCYTVVRVRRRGSISTLEAVLLISLVPVHILETQTGFDTVSSYVLLALFASYVFFLQGERKSIASLQTSRIAAGALALLGVASLVFVVWPEYSRQATLMSIVRSRSLEEQRSAIPLSLSRTSSFESLRVTSAAFILGSLSSIAEESTPQKIKNTLEFMDLYSQAYERYLAEKPDSYRGHINYAYLLLLRTALGDPQLPKARSIISESYALSPNHPLTYIMDSIAHLYGGDVAEADALMAKALAINPDVEFTQEAAEYLRKQKLHFPSISVIRMKNL